MDAELFANMLSDKSILDLKKLRYRYPQADMKEFVALLGNGVCCLTMIKFNIL